MTVCLKKSIPNKILTIGTIYGTIDADSSSTNMLLFMTYLIASEARKTLYNLIDKVATDHEPAIIKGKRNAAILVSAEDWENIQETIMVASDKALSDSLIKGKNTPYEDCNTKLF